MRTPNCIPIRRRFSISNYLGFIACLATAVLLPFGVMLGADEGPAAKAPKVKLNKKSEPDAKTVITGSLIPQKIKPDRIQVTTSPVIIIGQKEIERTGASTVTELLKKQGLAR